MDMDMDMDINRNDSPFDHDEPKNGAGYEYQRYASNLGPQLPYQPSPLDYARQEQVIAHESTPERLEAVQRAVATLYRETPGAGAISLTMPQAMAAALGLPPYPDAATNPKAFTPERMRALLLTIDMLFPKGENGSRPYGITLSWMSWGEIMMNITSPRDPSNWYSLLHAFGESGVTVDYGEDSIDSIRFYWPKPLPTDLQS